MNCNVNAALCRVVFVKEPHCPQTLKVIIIIIFLILHKHFMVHKSLGHVVKWPTYWILKFRELAKKCLHETSAFSPSRWSWLPAGNNSIFRLFRTFLSLLSSSSASVLNQDYRWMSSLCPPLPVSEGVHRGLTTSRGVCNITRRYPRQVLKHTFVCLFFLSHSFLRQTKMLFPRQNGHVDKVNEPFYSISLSTEVRLSHTFMAPLSCVSLVPGVFLWIKQCLSCLFLFFVRMKDLPRKISTSPARWSSYR